MNEEVMWVKMDVRKKREQGEIVNEMNIRILENEVKVKKKGK